MPRTAAIAIDAAEWWYVQRLLDDGRLPHLATVRERSAVFELTTPAPFRSELIWARFLTGREPLEDRDWAASMVFDPETYSIASTTASTRAPFYALGPGTKVVTLDLIHCALTEEGVDGEQVVAWGSHSPQWPRSSMPHGLLTDIDARFGTNRLFDNDSGLGWYQADYVDAFAEAGVEALGTRADIARFLLERTPDWDLFLMCMSEVHGAGHLMWHGVDPASPLHDVEGAKHAGQRFDEILVAADAALGRVLEAMPDDVNLVVFAMHGAQPADDLLCTVLLPELLHRRYIGTRSPLQSPDTAAWRGAGCPPIVPPGDYGWGEFMSDAFADTPKQRVRRAVRQLLSRRAFEALRRAAGRPCVPPLSALARPTPPETMEIDDEVLQSFRRAADYQVPAWYRRHWPVMPAFALPTFADGHIRLNLAGRERAGTVPLDDYAAVCDELVRLLEECRDARTGRPIVREVLRMRADEPTAADGPDCDLLVLWVGAPDAIEHPTLGVIGPFPHLRTAHHTTNGFAMVSGPGVEPGARGSAATGDLTATVLALIGRSNPTVRGSSLVELV